MLDQAGLVKTCPFSLKMCAGVQERAVAGQMGTGGTRGGFGLLGVMGMGPRSSTSAPRPERLELLEKLAGPSQKMELCFFHSKVNFVCVFSSSFFLFLFCLFESDFF